MATVTQPQQDLQDWNVLLQGVRARWPQAEEAFVERVKEWLRPVLDRLLPPALRCKCDLDDVTQEVLLVVFSRGLLARPLSTAGAFRALLVKVAHDRLIDLRRHYGWELRHQARQADDWLADVPAARVKPDPTEAGSGQEVSRLPPMPGRCRAIVLLLREGYPKAEILRKLGLRLRTFERALAWLRGHVGRQTSGFSAFSTDARREALPTTPARQRRQPTRF